MELVVHVVILKVEAKQLPLIAGGSIPSRSAHFWNVSVEIRLIGLTGMYIDSGV